MTEPRRSNSQATRIGLAKVRESHGAQLGESLKVRPPKRGTFIANLSGNDINHCQELIVFIVITVIRPHSNIMGEPNPALNITCIYNAIATKKTENKEPIATRRLVPAAVGMGGGLDSVIVGIGTGGISVDTVGIDTGGTVDMVGTEIGGVPGTVGMDTGGSSLTVGIGAGGTSDTVGMGAGGMSLMVGNGIIDALVTGGMTTAVELTSVGSSVVAVAVPVAVGTIITVEPASVVVVVGITRGPVSVGAA